MTDFLYAIERGQEATRPRTLHGFMFGSSEWTRCGLRTDNCVSFISTDDQDCEVCFS